MTQAELIEQIRKTRQLISQWPDWKQNNLVQASQPSVAIPRALVNNQSKPVPIPPTVEEAKK